MKVRELIDDLLTVAELDAEIEWRVAGVLEETVDLENGPWSSRHWAGQITTKVDIDARGELNDVSATKDGKVKVEVWI